MKRIRLAIVILSARRYAERRKRCRRMWTHELSGRSDVVWRFIVGRDEGSAAAGAGSGPAFSEDAEPDAVALDCPDDYPHLPGKTLGAVRWFLDRYDFDFLFKCDDDTYVCAERLLACLPPPHEYCGWSVSHSFPGSPDVASGGAGYFLSRRAARVVAEALADRPVGAEDDLVGRGLAAAGIALHHDPRFRWDARPGSTPAPSNDLITAHWVNSAAAEAEVLRPWGRAGLARTSPRDLVLKVGSRVIRWVIGPRHDREFTERVLLPWAAADALRLAAEARADFTVGVYLTSGEEVARVKESPGIRFILSGEPEARYAHGEGCYQFVQQPRAGDDPEWTRYRPMLCIWAPPVEGVAKARPCSVIESKGRPWRVELFARLRETVHDLDGYGSVYGRPLGGYHCVGPDPRVFSKHEGLAGYAFNASAERTVAEDYLTEKFADAILCETVPLYRGCPNLDEYAVPGSYHPLDRAGEIDWSDWVGEYAWRRPAVLRQKELIRSHFNVLSYFIRLTGTLELLDDKRAITLRSIGMG